MDLALGMGKTRFFDKIRENLVFSTIFKHVYGVADVKKSIPPYYEMV